MKATLEPIVYVMRFHDNADATLDNVTTYSAACTVTIDDRGVANIRGLVMDGLGTEAWRAAMDALHSVGAARVTFTRRNINGLHRAIDWPIKPSAKGWDTPKIATKPILATT